MDEPPLKQVQTKEMTAYGRPMLEQKKGARGKELPRENTT